MAKILSKKLDFSDGSYPLGGNDEMTFSSQSEHNIEANSILINAKSQSEFQLVSIDALYPGKVGDDLRTKCNAICASHTHYSPMIDDAKPRLGQMSQKAYDKWLACLQDESNSYHASFDTCIFLRANVPLHIYRRLDMPRNLLNKFLNPRVGLFPNEHVEIDNALYVWMFQKSHNVKFVFVYHAGHPVSRHDGTIISADYIASIRQGIREEYGQIPIIFLQGCGADIRPNITKKRRQYLPKFWLNRQFKAPPSIEEQSTIDLTYKTSIQNLKKIGEFSCHEADFEAEQKRLTVKGCEPILYPSLRIGNHFAFHFLPFELSHLFHLNIQARDKRCFLVSCCQDTRGYLPHPQQIDYGGYEVDKSREYMGLETRQELVESEFLI